MNRDDITRMAQQCNLIGMRPHLDGIYQESLERFAALVAEAAIKDAPDYKIGYADGVAAERYACTEKTGEFARKWWSIHCASNKHMETTRKAHDDFCALQAAIRARGQQ